MRTSVNLDEALLARAQELAGQTDRGQLLHVALRALIQREAARRLSRLAGALPEAADIPRRRAALDDPE